MAMLFSLTGAQEVKNFLNGTAQRFRKPRPGLKFIGEELQLSTARRMAAGVDVDGRPFKPSRRAEREGGQTLFSNGALANSVHYTARETDADYFSTDKRSRVHQEGLAITPKAGKQFLTIPLRATGGVFGGAVDIKGNRAGDRASHYSRASTFFLRKHGRLLLMQRTGKNAIRALFLLVRSVRMPRRQWFGFSGADLAMVDRVLTRHLLNEPGGKP